MGATIEIQNDEIIATAINGLQGTEIFFDKVTVTGTENIIMAAVLANGRTTLYNAAREPEVIDLIDFLVKQGASISVNNESIIIDGVKQLAECEHNIISDRIEAGTFLIAATMSQGEVELINAKPEHLTAVEKLKEAGAEIHSTEHSITLKDETKTQGC